MQCYTCRGRGYVTVNVTCPNCHGQGSYFKAVIGLGNVFEPCYQCGGKRTVEQRQCCQTCHGTGVINGPPKTDVLAGQWYDAQGNYYEIAKVDAHYRVTEHGALGQTGSGTASLSGNLVTLEMTNKMLGRYTLQLKLNGDSLQGATNVMGLSVPLVFTRS